MENTTTNTTTNIKYRTRPISVLLALVALGSLLGCATQYNTVRKQKTAISELQEWSAGAASANEKLRADNDLIRNQLVGADAKQNEMKVVMEQLQADRQEDTAKIDALLAGISRIEDIAKSLKGVKEVK